MTQLVELQAATQQFAEAGIKLYAISYDQLGALEAFAAAHGITFDLLSDERSAVIREFGILNHHITDDQVPFHGIPFPGTYLVDEDGIVTAKAFHRHLAQRESPEGLIDAALGDILLRSDEPTVTAEGDGGIDVSLTCHGGGGSIRQGQVRRLVVRVDLPDGLHIYDDPVPDAMVATSIEILSPDVLRGDPVEKPPTEPLELPGVGTLQVWSGRVDFEIPVWATSALAAAVGRSESDHVMIEVEIAYQACDEQACHLPQRTRLQLEVPFDPSITPNLGSTMFDGPGMTTMDSEKWAGDLVARGLESAADPAAAAAFLEDSMEHMSRHSAAS